jgi:hypothetical protein
VKRRLSGLVIGAAGLALMSVGIVRAADVGYTFRNAAQLDTTIAGEPIHGDFEFGAVNSAGDITFVTELENGEGMLLVEGNGKQTRLAKNGEPVPTGGTFGGYMSNNVRVNDAGSCLLSVGVDMGNGELQQNILFDKAANKWTAIAREGMKAPDAGTIQHTNSFGGLNNNNDVVFSGNVDATSAGPEGNGIFLSSKGTITNISRPGTKITRGAFVDSWRPFISNSGIVTFEGKIGDDDNYGAYMWKDGVITELAPVGAKAPDATGKATSDVVSVFWGVQANSNGDVVMMGNLDAGTAVYLWSAKDKTLRRIAGPGDKAPGGGTFAGVAAGFRTSVAIGEDGAVYFEANLDSGVGVFRWDPADQTIGTVARTGKAMAGVGKAIDTGVGHGCQVSSDGKVLFAIDLEDGVSHAIVATPPAKP